MSSLGKITFPHMGNLWVATKCMFEEFGQEVIVPPPITQRTITLGSTHSPEEMCVPFKYVLGNFIEALEIGADTIFMAGGIGPCRFGLYGVTAELILKRLGYNPQFVIVEPPAGKIVQFFWQLMKITSYKPKKVVPGIKYAAAKLEAVDWAEEEFVLKRQPYQKSSRQLDKLYKKFVHRINDCDGYDAIDKARVDFAEQVNAEVPVDPEKPVLDVLLTGEIFVLLEPYSNMEITRRLGELDCVCHRSSSATEWLQERILPSLFREKGEKFLFQKAIEKAEPWLKTPFGGEGIETVGYVVIAKEREMDGVIQVMPFTCMPEVTAKDVLPKVANEMDILFYSFIFDEHTAEAGFQTRVESFVARMWDVKKRGMVGAKV